MILIENARCPKLSMLSNSRFSNIYRPTISSHFLKIINLSRVQISKKTFFFNKIFSVQSFHPRLPPRFPQNLLPRLSPWFPQGKYLRHPPLISLQNTQVQFPLIILLLFCDFIFLVFIVLSYCYICRIRVILSQNYHIHSPLKCPQACPQGYTQG